MGDLKVPLALVLAMAVQLVGGVWWISDQAHKIEHLEDQISKINEDVDAIWNDTADLITFATYTENRWVKEYAGDMTYIRLFGTKQPPEEK